MTTRARFPSVSRLLHWLMAAMIVAMLFIGVGMAASLSPRYELLVSIHRPLGIAIFVLCLARIVNRFTIRSTHNTRMAIPSGRWIETSNS